MVKYKVVLVLSEELGIKCPQVHFTSSFDGNAGSAAEYGWLILPDYTRERARMMILTIAHGLRHIWQSVYQPELKENYVHVECEDDYEAYSLHPCEIDAEAYARKLAELVWQVDPFVDDNPKVLEALLKRRDEIDVSLSEGVKIYFEVLGELKE